MPAIQWASPWDFLPWNSTPKTKTFFRIIPFSVFLHIMSSTNTGYWRSVFGELSSVGIYAENPTLPEEEEIYAVDKTTIHSAAGIYRHYDNCLDGSPHPFPNFNHFIYSKGWFEAAPFLPPFQPLFLLHQRVIRCSPFSSHFFDFMVN